MSAIGTGTTIVGADAPIAMTANGGAGDVATWAHGIGQIPQKIEVVDAANKGGITSEAVGLAPGAGLGVEITVPDADNIVVTNLDTGAAKNVQIIVTWASPSIAADGEVPAADVVLSA